MTEPSIRVERIPEAPDLPHPLGRAGVNHDPRSRNFAFTAPEPLPLRDVAWRRRVPVYDQGRLGSCFPAGTRVRMADGSEQPIEDVRLLERVVTAEGNTGRVIRTMVRDEDEGIVHLKLWGHGHLRLTREHPVLTRRGYVAARDLLPADYVALPRYRPLEATQSISTLEHVTVLEHRLGSGNRWSGPPGRRGLRVGANPLPDKLELTASAGRLIGLFLAEGSSDSSKARWCYGTHESETLVTETVQLLEQEWGARAHVAARANNSTYVTVHGTGWARLMSALCGDHTGRKRPHPSLMGGSSEFLEAMLYGWLDGDGWKKANKGTIGTTISRDLALAMYDIAQMLGLRPTLEYAKAIQNRHARERQPRWNVAIRSSKDDWRCQLEQGHAWRKVKAIALEEFSGPVYDLEVEGDHSYVAEGVGVHNCTANALCGALSTLPDRHRFRSQHNIVGVYSDATRIDPWPGGWYAPDWEDTGSDGLSVAKVALSRGWISRYEHAFSFDAMLQALMVGPVIVGTEWRAEMFHPEPDGRVHALGSVVGGHEYEAYGVDVGNRRLWFWNSWGQWAVGGRFWMAWDDVRGLLAADGDATVLVP